MYVNEMQRTINGLDHGTHWPPHTIIPYDTWQPYEPGAIARGPFGAAQSKGFVGHLYDLFRPGTTEIRFRRDDACASGTAEAACMQLNTDYTAAVDKATKRMMYTGIAVAVVAGVGTTALVVRARRRKKGGR